MAAALVIIAAACSKSEVVNETEPEPETEAEAAVPAEENVPVKVTYIKAEGGETTKASINGTDATFTWNTGDRIAVYADGYKISDDLSSTYDGTNAATFSFSGANAVEENDRANFAVFPASLVYDSSSNLYETDVTESSLKINLPSAYTLAQVQDEVSPVPMIAENVKDGDLAFKSICALVRVTAVNISKDAHHIAVTFPGKKIQGEFTLTSVAPGTTGVVTADTDGTDDTITITDLGISKFTSSLVFNVPVPSGVADSQEYNDIKVTVYDSGNHKINSITTPLKLSAGVPVAWAPGRKASRKVTATLPVFTVASGKKVIFAPGNLQATTSVMPTSENPLGVISEWRFASNQRTLVGNTDSNKFYTKGDVDLFCWVGASATYDSYGVIYQSEIVGDYHGSVVNEELKSDWGTLIIDDYASNTWRTPTSSNWSYVFNTRSSSTIKDSESSDIANARFIKANVEGLAGLILFPDNYVHPYGMSNPANINKTGAESGGPTVAWNTNTITLVDWEKMEAAGCVFLPAAGYRDFGKSGHWIGGRNDSDPYDPQVRYWSKNGTQNSSSVKSAWGLNFNNTKGWVSSNGSIRRYGIAVRLIRDLN